MNKLIRMLKFAHAAEIAAYHAYEGHWKSVSDLVERERIQAIQLDELRHIFAVERMLDGLQSKPNKVMDWIGKKVGEFISLACFYTGWRLPMWVAGAMENIGTASYKDIALEAANQERYIMAAHLLEMAKVEQEHEDYFEKTRKAK